MIAVSGVTAITPNPGWSFPHWLAPKACAEALQLPLLWIPAPSFFAMLQLPTFFRNATASFTTSCK